MVQSRPIVSGEQPGVVIFRVGYMLETKSASRAKGRQVRATESEKEAGGPGPCALKTRYTRDTTHTRVF